MNRWTRASIVLAVVGVALLALAAVAVAGPLRAGAEFATLLPIVLGVGLKGVLALLGAAVMAWAAHLETVRLSRAATCTAAAQTCPAPPTPAVAAPGAPVPAAAEAARYAEAV